MRCAFVLLFLLPLCAYAEEHNVPIGTDENQLIFSVKNGSLLALKEVQVTIQSAPDWVVFEASNVVLDEIPSREKRDARFPFRVLEGEADRTGTVRLAVTDAQGRFLAHRAIPFRAELALKETRLYSPYPNPANPKATIRYVLREPAHMRLEVYNVVGQRIRTLVDEEKPAGMWRITWDGRNDGGAVVATGVYLIRLETIAKGKTNQYTSRVLLEK